MFFAEVDGEKFVELTSLAKRVQKKRGDKALVAVWRESECRAIVQLSVCWRSVQSRQASIVGGAEQATRG